jgi:hypothetical protein
VERENFAHAWSRVCIYVYIRQEFCPNSSCEKFRLGGGGHLKLCMKFNMCPFGHFPENLVCEYCHFVLG